MHRRPLKRQFVEETGKLNVENVLTRLDSIVDRLEGVYSQLLPLLEQQGAGRVPVEITLDQERVADGGA